MMDWSKLTHAYGSAGDVPAMLEQAESDPQGPIWRDLGSCLYHQGTVYSASYAALPTLTRLARQWTPTQRQEPLLLACGILSSTDRPYDQPDPLIARAAEIAELTALAEETLRDSSLADDEGAYLFLLQALLAFEGVEVRNVELEGLANDEYEVPCPHCEADNFIAFGEHGCFSTLDAMYMNDTSSTRKRIPLQPEDPAALDGLAKRLHTRVLADGHPDIAHKLTYVFGSAHCAECGALFRVDQAVGARCGH